MQQTSQQWAVVGGGVLGLTLALRLREAGYRVTVLESAPHLGGLADAWQLGDITWDRHYHVTLLSDQYLRGVLRALQLEDEVRWVETKTGFFTDGKLHSMSDTWEFLTFPPLGLYSKLRLGFTIFYAARIRAWKRLEKIPVADWLRRWSGKKTFQKIWLPLLRSKLGDNYRITSAAFIWATIARMYAARRTGLKKEMFGYVRGGYGRVLRRFEELLRERGVEICCNCNVREVLAHPDGGGVVSFGERNSRYFDQVVLTVPSGLVPKMCPGLSDQEKQQHEAIQYQGIVCLSLLLKRPLSSFYVTNITDGAAPFTGVIEMTALVDPAEFGGKSLVYLPLYLPQDDPVWDESDQEVTERFLAGLTHMHPDLKPADVLASRISRVRRVMAISTLDYSANLPPIKTSLPNVFVVNSAQIVNGTLNVNETIRLAEEAIRSHLLPDGAEPRNASYEFASRPSEHMDGCVRAQSLTTSATPSGREWSDG